MGNPAEPREPRADRGADRKVMEKISEEEFSTITNIVIGHLEVHGEDGYLQGNEIVKLLSAEVPDLVVTVKQALGGKGWLKCLLELHPMIEQVQVDGKGEPCYT